MSMTRKIILNLQEKKEKRSNNFLYDSFASRKKYGGDKKEVTRGDDSCVFLLCTNCTDMGKLVSPAFLL